MSQKNETPVLILALAITLALLAGGFWMFRGLFGLGGNSNNVPSISNNTNTNTNTNKTSDLIQQRLSLGDRILINTDNTVAKQAGVIAFGQGDYKEAIKQFQLSLQTLRNDPETLIYLNNSQAVDRNPVKISVSVPIGNNPNVAKEILRGVAQAQNQINQQGGVNGRLLQVEIANDDNNPETAKQIAQKFVNDSSILAVIGHNSSDATLAAAPIYQQNGLVMISPTSDAKAISELGDYIFRTIPSIRFQADTLSRYTINTAKKTNIVICFDSKSEYSKSLKEDFTSAVFADGGRVVEANCDFAADDFNPSTIVSQAISNGADAFLLIPNVNKINLAIDIAQANQRRLFLLGNSTMYTIQTLQEGQENVNGMVLSAPWHPMVFKNNDFTKEAPKLWGGEVNWRSALANDAMEVIITGLKESNMTRQGLQQAISNSSFVANGASGKIQFLPSGDRNGTVILLTIKPGKQSNSGLDFVPLKND